MKYAKDKYWLHILLFFITLITTLFAGMWFIVSKPGPYEISEFAAALPYAFFNFYL